MKLVFSQSYFLFKISDFILATLYFSFSLIDFLFAIFDFLFIFFKEFPDLSLFGLMVLNFVVEVGVIVSYFHAFLFDFLSLFL